MKKLFFMSLIIGVVCISFSMNEVKKISSGFILKKELSIGNEADDNYLFGTPTDISVDHNGNIYILDIDIGNIRKYNKSGIFMNSIGREGEGPGEFPDYIWLQIETDSKGNLVVLYSSAFAKRKAMIFNPQGVFVRSFQILEYIYSAALDKEDNIIVGSGSKDILFYRYDQKGELLDSFGPLFSSFPEEYRNNIKINNIALIPFNIFFDQENHRVLACHPLQYEIWSFTRKKSIMLISRNTDSFQPYYYIENKGKKIKLRSIFSVFKIRDLIVMTLQNPATGRYQMDIFKNLRMIVSMPVNGHLLTVDSQNKLYFFEENESQVVRYRLVEK